MDFDCDRRIDNIIVEELEEHKPQAESLYCEFCHKYLGIVIGENLYKDGNLVMRIHDCKRKREHKQERSG